eukprot:15364463-Ditylum_brightwellii.AAC.1
MALKSVMLVGKVITHVCIGVYDVTLLSKADDTDFNKINFYTILKYGVKNIENEIKYHTQNLESSDYYSSTGGAELRCGYTSDDAIGSTDSYGEEEDTSNLEEESDGEKEAAESIERKEKKGCLYALIKASKKGSIVCAFNKKSDGLFPVQGLGRLCLEHWHFKELLSHWTFAEDPDGVDKDTLD